MTDVHKLEGCDIQPLGPKLAAVLRAVLEERRYQDEKWGPPEKQNNRDTDNWCATVQEELSEADHNTEDVQDWAIEMVQVAAVAIAALEQLAPEDIDVQVGLYRMASRQK